ncbi:MAG: RnfABCDGE type electron transport complex subunit D [Chitinivibrionales bacterium]|nr:RnfABCDGE type electron transport complex subunit D [Chitinivibrionales bacterium]
MPQDDQGQLLALSSSPHIRYPDNVSTVMLSVVIALIPALLASIIFFGIKALILTLTCIIFCLLTEWLIATYLFKQRGTLNDFSALVTALLLAFNLPPDLPPWMAALGSVFAIGVVKWAFGGLGNNFVNPALAGRAFLMASYAAPMTRFSIPGNWQSRGWTISGLPQQVLGSLSDKLDGISGATPLPAFVRIIDALKNEQLREELNISILDFQEALPDLFIGNIGGCIGETSALALLIGAVYLLYKRIIGFKIPGSYIGTVFVLSWLFNGTGSLLTTEAFLVPVYQILAGGLMLGALYMATDMVTSPITPWGQIYFGVGCGVLTFVIRQFGGYPEGVSYSILLMNLVAPLIDRYTRPRLYGKAGLKRG